MILLVILSIEQALFSQPDQMMFALVLIVLIAPIIAIKFKLPGVIGLIIFGFLVGPNCFNLLNVGKKIDLLETIGILFIMFNAGLELDLEQFSKLKKRTFFFGTISLIFPVVVMLISTLFLLKSTILVSLFLGIMVGSHTLLSYPLVTEYKANNDESVTLSIGGTLITDCGALIMLSVVVSLAQRAPIDLALGLIILAVGIILYFLFSLLILPKIAKRFFKLQLSDDKEFIFTLLIMFGSAFLAESIGLVAIVGAFMGGLSLNKLIPKDSRLMQKIHFIGNSFFIPIFMVYVGMLVDIRAIFSNVGTLLTALALVFSVLVGKGIAALIVGKLYKMNKYQISTIWTLTIPQIGATFATLFVGISIGLINDTDLNAVIILLVVTSLISQIVTAKVAPKLAELQQKDTKIDLSLQPTKILVLLTKQESVQNLVDISGIIVKNNDGTLYPLYVSTIEESTDSGIPSLNFAEERKIPDNILENAHHLATDLGIHVETINRIDNNIINGIFNSSLENKIDLLLMEWDKNEQASEYFFSKNIDIMLKKTLCPIGIVKIESTINLITQIVLYIDNADVQREYFETFIVAAKNLSISLGVNLMIIDVSRFSDRMIKNKLNTNGPKKHFSYYKLFGYSPMKISEYFGQHDLVLATIPPYHPVFSLRGYDKLSLYSTPISVVTDNSLILFYYPQVQKDKRSKNV